MLIFTLSAFINGASLTPRALAKALVAMPAARYSWLLGAMMKIIILPSKAGPFFGGRTHQVILAGRNGEKINSDAGQYRTLKPSSLEPHANRREDAGDADRAQGFTAA